MTTMVERKFKHVSSGSRRRDSDCAGPDSFTKTVLTEGPAGVIHEVDDTKKNNNAGTITVIDEEGPGLADINNAAFPKPKKKKSGLRFASETITSSVPFAAFIGLCTLYSLIASDLRLAATDISADSIFAGTAAAVMGVFIIELVLNFIVTGKGFVRTFQFWLDIISIFAMVADIPWIFDPLMGNSLDSGTLDNLTVTRAGRVSRLATRTARIGRVFRIARLLRLTAITQWVFAARNNHHQVDSNNSDGLDVIDVNGLRRHSSTRALSTARSNPNASREATSPISLSSEMAEGSAIGRKMSELTTMRVVMIVLLIVLVVPFLDDVARDEPVSVALQRIESETNVFARQVYIDSLVNTGRVNLLYLRIGDKIYVNKPLDKFRSNEIDSTEESTSEAIQDIQYRVRAQALANLILMVFTVFVLGFGALMFSRDAFVLVIGPIERMVQFVRKLATNPLDVADMSMLTDEKQRRLETELLESTFIRLGSLLQIGFGTAGASIIAKNFKDRGRVLNPMLPGSRVNAVFAFCDIRRFTDATECLKESVMVFVNEIANVVHGCCHRLGGAANKNIGDAFFIVWKLGDDEEEIRHPMSDGTKFIADQSIIAFVHCIVELLTSPLLQRWRDDTRLTDRIPGYNINLGVGIHWGWAIEGAIGTEQKIDASYLSPHVEMSQTLEEMTKVYGVPLLFSGEVFDILSPQLQSMCRLLDAVAQAGSQNPLRVYTFDIGNEALEIQKKEPSMPSSLNRGSISLKDAPATIIKRMSIMTGVNLMESSAEAEVVTSDNTDDYVLIDFSTQVKPYRVGIDPRWVDMFSKAVRVYLSGNWSLAKTILESCRTMVPNDPPTRFLLDFMECSGPNAPPDWPGYRTPTDSH